MTRFEPRTSGIGSDSFTNWATTSATFMLFWLSNAKWKRFFSRYGMRLVNQCDQIWRIFATLAKFNKSLATVLGLILYLAIFWTYFLNFSLLLGNHSSFKWLNIKNLSCYLVALLLIKSLRDRIPGMGHFFNNNIVHWRKLLCLVGILNLAIVEAENGLKMYFTDWVEIVSSI